MHRRFNEMEGLESRRMNAAWVSGTLEASDGRSADCYADFYTVTARKTGSATITMTSSDADSYLIIQNGSGSRQIRRDDNSAAGMNARTKFKVVKGQTYTIVASSAYTDDAGSYRLGLSSNLGTVKRLAPRVINMPSTDVPVVVDPGFNMNRGFGSRIANQRTQYNVRITSGGTYAHDSNTGLVYSIVNLTGRTGRLVVNPAYPSDGGNDRNARDFGLFITNNLFSLTPGLGPGGDMHFATNTSLPKDLGVRAASTLWAGAVDASPRDQDIVNMSLDERSGKVSIKLDQNNLGSTGQRNWFIKSQQGLLAAGPVPIVGGTLDLEFSEDGSTVTGKATFFGTDVAGWSYGTAMYSVTFSGSRI